MVNNIRQCSFNNIIGVIFFNGRNYFPYFLKSIYVILDILCFSKNDYQNQVTVVFVSIYCCFIVLFTRGGLNIAFVISVSINFTIISGYRSRQCLYNFKIISGYQSRQCLYNFTITSGYQSSQCLYHFAH